MENSFPKGGESEKFVSTKNRLYLFGRRDAKADVMVGFGSGKFTPKLWSESGKLSTQVSSASQMDQFWDIDNVEFPAYTVFVRQTGCRRRVREWGVRDSTLVVRV